MRSKSKSAHDARQMGSRTWVVTCAPCAGTGKAKVLGVTQHQGQNYLDSCYKRVLARDYSVGASSYAQPAEGVVGRSHTSGVYACPRFLGDVECPGDRRAG